MLRKMMPKKKKKGVMPVYLNVYDLTPMNGYAYWFGLGVYHSGVEVHGVEYAFGAHDHASTGVYEVEPKQCPGFIFRKAVLIGRTDMSAEELCKLMEELSKEYSGSSYHLISKNCNHFCDELCYRLTGKQIPSWVNRLARLGLLCKCVFPVALDETRVRQIMGDNKIRSDYDKKKLRSQSSRWFEHSRSAPSTLSTCSTAPTSRSRRQRRCIPPSSSSICAYSPQDVVV